MGTDPLTMHFEWFLWSFILRCKSQTESFLFFCCRFFLRHIVFKRGDIRHKWLSNIMLMRKLLKAQMRLYISNEAMVLKGKVGISVTGHIIRLWREMIIKLHINLLIFFYNIFKPVRFLWLMGTFDYSLFT